MLLSRRELVKLSGAAAVATAVPGSVAKAEDLPGPIAALEPMTDGVSPITLEERQARLARAQTLMAEDGLDAVVLAAGTSLAYFSGASWRNSERFFGMVLSREGEPAWVTPALERERAGAQREEHESPYALVASILSDRKAAQGRVGIGETMPFVFAHEIGKAVPGATIASATAVTAGCRMIKDAHELALMRRANEITLRAHRAVFASLELGMTKSEASHLSVAAHERLGINGGALVLFGADAAYPHGTTKPQPLKRGDVVLIDGGGRLHGYRSDITRTGVFGAPPTDRQRKVWNVVRKAQQAAFEAARPGVECQAVDAAAREAVEKAGFGAGYEHFSHRVGHGIGMDGHEWTYLVRGNTAKLRPGMCFSDEPGIYIYGEMGVRHEDIIHITADGAESLTPWSGSPEDPAVLD
ncbi:MAG: aminopeptidase P family protein [Deltaproteobacteria bacterium]|nr:aminopeptidase P family protein [Deltaproteobacteria bacterium]